MKSKHRLSLSTRLTLLSGVLVLMSIVTAESYFMRHERAMLELQLRDKINFISNYYALGIAEALQRHDDVMLQQILSGLEQDSDITSVIVVDGKSHIRYHSDPEKIGETLDDALVKRSMATGEAIATPIQNAGGKALELVTPLKARGQSAPLGIVRLEVTYRHIEQQVHAGPASFEMMATGCIFMVIGGVLWGYKQWVLAPIGMLRLLVSRINPSLLEANLPEGDDEFGQIYKTLNELLAKLKGEWGAQREAMKFQAADERVLIEQIVRGLLPGKRTLLVDKDNQLICDTERDIESGSGGTIHLLDYARDANFSTLIRTALQKEGDVASGPVALEDRPYEASILCIPQGQSKLVRMVIVLRSTSPSQTKKEAV
jgi:hypothetical protein